ncbi:MAG: molybdenum ABC transporter ATP-binding protein [Verrucomicrobia bacterium]|jgi:molybdate transport system ATP-binding protein|nr:molybdenum ABC transporter ATP-binding protein [Verrucomicrobiota bacterium]
MPDWFQLSPFEWSALRLSLVVACWAVGLSLPFGIAWAWILARKEFPGKFIIDGLLHLPLVLPPVVVGYVLLVLFGRNGSLGPWLESLFFQGAERGITALYGPSGAGKTTVVQVVAGLIRPDEAQIELQETCLFSSAEGINLPAEKRRIGYVFQDARLFPHYSVASNLSYGEQRVPATQRFIELDSVIKVLGIGHLLKRRPSGLSGGETQRVAIGRALLSSPAVLLMDEPLNSLDDARKAELLPYIRKIAETFNVPILYVSHSVEEIRQLADTVVVLQDGAVTRYNLPA